MYHYAIGLDSCENSIDTIWAPTEYTAAIWSYITNTGKPCQDWDALGSEFFFSLDSNDPCFEDLSLVTITFEGYSDDYDYPA